MVWFFVASHRNLESEFPNIFLRSRFTLSTLTLYIDFVAFSLHLFFPFLGNQFHDAAAELLVPKFQGNMQKLVLKGAQCFGCVLTLRGEGTSALCKDMQSSYRSFRNFLTQPLLNKTPY